MKIIGVLSVRDGADFETQIKPLLLREEQTAWAMYLDGFVREMYLTHVQGTVISVVEAESLDEVRERFAALPMVQAGLLDMELYALSAFANWQVLMDPANQLEAPAT